MININLQLALSLLPLLFYLLLFLNPPLTKKSA